MTCDERRELWLLFASGGFAAEEERELGSHLESGCAQCAGALAEAEVVLAQLPVTLPPVALPTGLRERLVARAAADRRSAGPGRPARQGFRALGRLAAAAALALAAVSAGFLWRQSALESRLDAQARRLAELEQLADRSRALEQTVARQAIEIERLEAVVGPATDVLAIVERQRNEIARLTATLEKVGGTVDFRDEEIRRLRLRLDDHSLRMASYGSPDVWIFGLEGTAEARTASARVFWNTERRRWDFYASGLEPAGLARTYQLWFVTGDGRKVSAGTFDVGDGGEAALIDVQVPLDVGLVAAAAVTDEPAGGSLQPSGRIRLVGETRRG